MEEEESKGEGAGERKKWVQRGQEGERKGPGGKGIGEGGKVDMERRGRGGGIGGNEEGRNGDADMDKSISASNQLLSWGSRDQQGSQSVTRII